MSISKYYFESNEDNNTEWLDDLINKLIHTKVKSLKKRINYEKKIYLNSNEYLHPIDAY